MIDLHATGPDVEPSVSLPELHLSKPGIHLPAVRVDNAEIIRRVRAPSKGSDAEFATIASAIEHVFGLCKTRVRYLEPDKRPGIIADYAVAAAKNCLEVNDVSPG